VELFGLLKARQDPEHGCLSAAVKDEVVPIGVSNLTALPTVDNRALVFFFTTNVDPVFFEDHGFVDTPPHSNVVLDPVVAPTMPFAPVVLVHVVSSEVDVRERREAFVIDPE